MSGGKAFFQIFVFLLFLATYSYAQLGENDFKLSRRVFGVQHSPPKSEFRNPNEWKLQSFRNVRPGALQFGLDLFAKISDGIAKSKQHTDVMISPFAIWSLLLLLVEGAAGKTLQQLRTALHIDEDQDKLRQAYSFVQQFLTAKTDTIEVGSLQAIFTSINEPPKREYENIITEYYRAQLTRVDFHNPNETYHRINEEVRVATKGLIEHALLPQDLLDARILMLSTLYFKGQWKHRFNTSQTRSEPFYDEDGNRIGNVEMMVQEANFNYARINELEGHVLELPYGRENRLSMLVILPKTGVTLNKVIHNLQSFGITEIFKRLTNAAVGYEDDEVEVHLPKFTTLTDLSLPSALYELGIEDIFSDKKADLSQIAANLFVNNILHSTKIIVDEEGTEAAAVTSATLINKAAPPKFHLNRPFVYLIMEKTTEVLLFAGQVVNPNKLQYPLRA